MLLFLIRETLSFASRARELTVALPASVLYLTNSFCQSVLVSVRHPLSVSLSLC
jgi:hypothetical protein